MSEERIDIPAERLRTMTILVKLVALGDAKAAVDLTDRIARLSSALAAAEETIAELRQIIWDAEENDKSDDVQLQEANAKIAVLSEALKPFAGISLRCDTDQNGPDMIEAPDLAITPKQVRTARKALFALPASASALLDDMRCKTLEEAAKICDQRMHYTGQELAMHIRALSHLPSKKRDGK